ncbi:acyltransferase family protein [Seonamhaeicola maritimus]|uniref:acyltransferase family protein n=1 Tax=Seonamhaeicola maritimus TaxID=2591822 RepID=UPI002494268A|nr:acyltransferase [Seonamhaeicola maritimus]
MIFFFFKILHIEINPERNYGLDILRALAILFVVTKHGTYLLPSERRHVIDFFLFDGVAIFFVLSGFLIGRILIRTLERQEINFKLILNFWIRRWFRTLPNYFLILVLLLILNFIFTDDFSIQKYRCYFIFSQNLYYNHPKFFPEAWSLSIEEWFYLLIPIILLIILKSLSTTVRRTVLLTALSILIGVTALRYFRFNSLTDIPANWGQLFFGQVVSRLDSIMYGVIGAYCFYYFKQSWYKYKVLFLCLGIILFVNIKFKIINYEEFGFYHSVFSSSVYALATLFLLPFLSSLKEGKGFVYRFITYISLISYSMYLLNLSVVQIWILKNIDWSYLHKFNGYAFLLIRYASYWFFTIVISILIYKYFEIPLMNLRDKIKVK